MKWTAKFLLVLVLSSQAFASELPPLEAYGSLPGVDLVTLSPSGERLAMRRTEGDIDIVMVIDLTTGQRTSAVDVSSTNPRSLKFVSDDMLLLIAGQTTRMFGIRGAFDYSAAFAMNTNTSETRQLLTRADDLFSAQSGLGRIVGASADGKTVYMPAFEGPSQVSSPRYSLFEVRTDRRRERLKRKGNAHTIDWFVDVDGEPIIREDFDNQDDKHIIWRIDGKERTRLYEYESDIKLMNPVGLLPDRSALLYTAIVDNTVQFFTLSLADGTIGGPLLSRDDKDIDRVLMDSNRIVLGVQYTGFTPSYAFFDDSLNQRIASITEQLADTSVRLHSWSDDFSKLVVQVTGGWNSGAYVLFTDGEQQPSIIALERPEVANEAVVPTEITSYEAKDGLTIPALVSARSDVREAGDAPLVVIPHGGPESYDALEFHWMTQYFASRGYVVLQPQFRGSEGFGWDFRAAGRGEWGGKMQTDLDDGVAHLVESGLVDADRVCIVGASYGGYAAIAAAAFTKGIYRCAASINGVFDLRTMIVDERRDYGRDHWVIAYWEKLYGADSLDRAALDAISPAKHADKIDIPVLLIHGKDDTVVPVRQSRRMQRALRSAKADYDYVELDGEDHWLSYPTSRLETLKAVGEFIDSHL
ncbi:MAG: alpha/beta fold hydrolase [Pseudomonadota bacterium]